MWGFQAAKKRNQQQILERVPHSQLSSQLRIWEELLNPPASFCKWNICVIISLYLIASSSDSWFLADGDLGKLRVRSSTPVGVEHHCESDSLCMDPVAPGTGKDLGWGWLGGCLLLPPAALFCSFCASQSQSYNWPFSPTISAWGLLQPRLMVGSCLCKLHLQLVFAALSWCITITPFFLDLVSCNTSNGLPVDCECKLKKKTSLGIHFCLPSLVWGQPRTAAGQAVSWGRLHLIHSLAIWCQWWSANSVHENAQSSLICFWWRPQVSAPCRRLGETALYTWVFIVHGKVEWMTLPSSVWQHQCPCWLWLIWYLT